MDVKGNSLSVFTKMSLEKEYTNRTILLLLFLICPLASFVFSLFFLNKKTANITLFLFIVLFAYSMTNIDTEGPDLNRYLEYPKNCVAYNSITELVTSYDFVISGGDYYRAFMGFIVSRFTTNGHILMALLGMVWAILYLKSKSLFDVYRCSRKDLSYVLLLLFFLAYGVAHLGNVRFPTAALLFFYSSIKYLHTRKLKYLIILGLVPLFHSAFIIYDFLFLVIVLFPKNIRIYFILLLLAFVVKNLNVVAGFSFVLNYLPNSLALKYASYVLDENYLANSVAASEVASLHVKYMYILIELSSLWIIINVFLKKKILYDTIDTSIACFLLLLYVFYYLSPLANDVNQRTLHLSSLFVYYLCYKLWARNKVNYWYRNCLLVLICASIPMLFYNLKLMLYFTKVDMVYGSLPSLILNDSMSTIITNM